MINFNDTVKNLLKDIKDLDEKIIDMIGSIRNCRKECLETVNTIGLFNNDIEINYKNNGDI